MVERVEPERLFSYRWHPYAIDPNVDYSTEPTTLVEFRLAEVPDGTRLIVVESGSFDRLPAQRRRAEAFRMNDSGLGRADEEHRAPCRQVDTARGGPVARVAPVFAALGDADPAWRLSPGSVPAARSPSRA